MADNVYLLETRLSPAQQIALAAVRDAARQSGFTVFLVGGAVRDLMSGSPVRDLDFAIQGTATELRKALEQAGGAFSGESTERQALFLRFPGAVRVELSSTLSVSYPKPGKPVYEPTSILEDLRRRDFTANAMALSLNDGSYGLLMDPLNGVADIENRELRLVSNYGFIEDPVRMIRAARLMARLGWQMEERTRSRYETGKEENYIEAMQPAERAYELEEFFHEEDPLRVMRRLEEEGWLSVLSPSLSVAKTNVVELGRLREVQMQFQTRGILADAAAANFPMLTAKLAPAEVEAIRSSFPRAGFTEEIQTLESSAKELVARVLSKEMVAPSAAYRFLLQAPPATVVYAAYSSRSAAFQSKIKGFLTDWPTAQSRIPYALMAEMRITPELPGYPELLEKLFYAFMDGQLETTEEVRAFLEPYSPPAPPPPVSLRRARAPRKEAKSSKSKKKGAEITLAASIEDVAAEGAPDQPAEPATASPVVQAVTPEVAPVQPAEARPSKNASKPPAKSHSAKPSAGPQHAKPAEKKTQVAAATPEPAKPSKKAAQPAKAAGKHSPAVKATTAPTKTKPALVAAKSSQASKATGKTKQTAASKRMPTKSASPAKRPLPAKKAAAKRPVETKPAKRSAAPVRALRLAAAKKPAGKKAAVKAPPARSSAKATSKSAGRNPAKSSPAKAKARR